MVLFLDEFKKREEEYTAEIGYGKCVAKEWDRSIYFEKCEYLEKLKSMY